jgi:hypothetical protein
VAIIFGIGMALLLAFLLWTFAMVFLQALDQWRRSSLVKLPTLEIRCVGKHHL